MKESNITITYKLKKHLLNQLKEFGLNPRHWEITTNGSRYHLSHLKEKDLNLEGMVCYREDTLHWANLKLMNF